MRMLGFASGVMMAASFWSLLAPAIEMSARNGPAAIHARGGRLSGGGHFYLPLTKRCRTCTSASQAKVPKACGQAGSAVFCWCWRSHCTTFQKGWRLGWLLARRRLASVAKLVSEERLRWPSVLACRISRKAWLYLLRCDGKGFHGEKAFCMGRLRAWSSRLRV
jgi:hypothetical protein